MTEPPAGGWPHLAGCSRCGRLHHSGWDPPLDWAPLQADHDSGIWGVVCPDCRAEIGDAVITLRVMRPFLRAVPAGPAEP